MTCKTSSCHSCHSPDSQRLTLEEELCLEIARQYDEEDLTHPPHRLHHYVHATKQEEPTQDNLRGKDENPQDGESRREVQ